ncbi:hypothetical protein PIB30_099040 [Stylosanthes scabra]|uniref:Uncharacterized protein n=1 Tax=Stylosanthes scabra TaxID=79078 RepID=A0ABU6TXB0_9FABA|nr:hypothetical protein [Stylosanthes scabra]
MDARRYRSLFGQRRVVLPSSQHEASEASEEDSKEHGDTYTSSDTSHNSIDISSVDASQGSNRESNSFDSGPSSRSSFNSGSSGRWSGSTISSGTVSSEDDLANRHFGEKTATLPVEPVTTTTEETVSKSSPYLSYPAIAKKIRRTKVTDLRIIKLLRKVEVTFPLFKIIQ